MRPPRLLALVCILWAIGPPARADLVLSTFPSNPSDLQRGNPGLAYGQEFQAGTAELSSLTARLQLDPGSLPANLGRLHLVLDNANPNGTIGSTFFDGFTASGSATTGIIVFAPQGEYTMTAGSAYWLVLTDRDGGTIDWDFSSSSAYTSGSGYGIPAVGSSYFNDGTNPPSYTDLAAGPQVFSLEKPFGLIAVPEPSALALVATGLLGSLVFRRGRRASRPEPSVIRG